jgi:hypothetical protein
MGEPCLFCLEEASDELETFVVPFNLALEPSIPCACRFNAHMNCWMQYFFIKGGFECPICHSKVPLQSMPRTEVRQQNITIQTRNQVYHIQGPTSTAEPIVIQLPGSDRGNQSLTLRQRLLALFVIGMCLVFIIFSVFSTIIFRP